MLNVATALPLPLDEIARLCRHYGVQKLAVFGSVLRSDFRSDSDVDFLVTFHENDSGPWMSKLQDLEADLSTLLEREVDLVDGRGLTHSRNGRRRDSIMASAVTIYEG